MRLASHGDDLREFFRDCFGVDADDAAAEVADQFGQPALMICKLSIKLAGTTSKANALRSASVIGQQGPVQIACVVAVVHAPDDGNLPS